MQYEDIEVDFSVRQIQEQRFAIEVRYADVTLTGESNYIDQQFYLDGYVSASGADIVLTDQDVLIMNELGEALADAQLINSYRPDVEHQRGVVIHGPGSALARTLAVWTTKGVGESPEREIIAEHGRTIDYLCGYLTGYGIPASHDCWDCWNTWDGWNNVNIGPQGSANCYPDSCGGGCSNKNTYSCGRLSCEQSGGGGNGTWQWGSNSDKYAACTVWDTNAYTRDCLMHDHCVRNDHDTFSGWCSDDAVPASDDQSSANDCIMKDGCSGSCGGYSASGGCWCDSGCDSYGDCCMDKHQKCG
ncbi:MAG: hypothetical protein KC457_02170 [Myxococcales bacterium]|nr:hypothetical protein [Myxococcales bacterium]